jgi:lipoyl(octanoyl) transferase
LLLVEHPHVYTLGKSGDRAHLLAGNLQLSDRQAAFVHVDRGGDITYHGPGQLVAYPILDLDRIRYPDGGRATDIHRYLRELEGAIIDVCGEYGIAAERIAGRTGVWVPADERLPARKICAFGIRCSRWVTMHGLALNVETDLSYFDLIVPCGIRDAEVTSISRELGRSVPMDDVVSRFLTCFGERFGVVVEEDDIPSAFLRQVRRAAPVAGAAS